MYNCYFLLVNRSVSLLEIFKAGSVFNWIGLTVNSSQFEIALIKSIAPKCTQTSKKLHQAPPRICDSAEALSIGRQVFFV
jgi:hypothetical protein